MILEDAEEIITIAETDEESYEEIYKTSKRQIPMLVGFLKKVIFQLDF